MNITAESLTIISLITVMIFVISLYMILGYNNKKPRSFSMWLPQDANLKVIRRYYDSHFNVRYAKYHETKGWVEMQSDDAEKIRIKHAETLERVHELIQALAEDEDKK